MVGYYSFKFEMYVFTVDLFSVLPLPLPLPMPMRVFVDMHVFIHYFWTFALVWLKRIEIGWWKWCCEWGFHRFYDNFENQPCRGGVVNDKVSWNRYIWVHWYFLFMVNHDVIPIGFPFYSNPCRAWCQLCAYKLQVAAANAKCKTWHTHAHTKTDEIIVLNKKK